MSPDDSRTSQREMFLARLRNDPTQCDHCGQLVRRVSGWYVGSDGASDCSASPSTGHEVNGAQS